MPNHATVPSIPGWMVLTTKAAAVAGLAMVARLLQSPRERRAVAASVAPEPPFEVPALPPFVSDIVDLDARYYRAQLRDGRFLFTGFYSDGRVRMATPEGRRFSGITVDANAVMADLREDVSFEVAVERSDDALALRVDGGPYDGQTLACVAVS